MLNHILGVKPTLVPFNGNAPAINALLGDQVDYLCGTSFTEVGQQVQSGLLKAYAFGGNERHPALPTVPTFMEAGLPEFQGRTWHALFAPKDTPRPILDKLTNALNMALNEGYARNRLIELGYEIPDDSKRGQQPLTELVKSEIARWSPIMNAVQARR
jgi:tripartite-type tricarboxylate transporter receptor subunit TctC